MIEKSAKVIGDVILEEDVSLWYYAVLRGDVCKIHIGKGSNIQDHVVIHGGEGNDVRIGEYVSVGHSCVLHGCTIDDNCIIGMGSIILDEAHIAKNTIVGAGSLVTKGKDFPEGSLVMGNPARLIRPLTEQEIESIRQNALDYIQYAKAM